MKKKEPIKYIFITILVVCFVLTMAFTKNKKQDNEIQREEESKELDNEDSFNLVDLNDEETGMIFVNGEGELTKAIMDDLLDKAYIDTSEVYHVIVGDDVTEIGYNAFVGWKYLESIKLGKKVVQVHNGAINYDPELKYIFIPGTVVKFGKDFSYGCNENLCIITEESIEFLDKLKINYEDFTYFTEVTSMEDFIDEFIRLTPPYASYCGNELICTAPNAFIENDKNMYLAKDYRSFGPYVNLEKGNYRIRIEGRNLDLVESKDIICADSEQSLSMTNYECSDSFCQWQVNAPKDMQSVEFSLFNGSDDNVVISDMYIYQIMDYDDEFSFMKKW